MFFVVVEKEMGGKKNREMKKELINNKQTYGLEEKGSQK